MEHQDTSTALVLTHDIAAPLVVFDAATAAEAKAIAKELQAIRALGRVDDTTLARADAAVRRGAGLARRIETNRVAVKAPVLALGRAIDAACTEHIDSLDTESRAVATLIDAHQQRKLAEARAAEEAQRRAVEEAARIAEERRMQDEAAIAALQSSGEPLTPEDAVVVAELEAEAEVKRELDAVVPLPMVPHVPKTGVSRRMVDELIIDDIDAIPREVNGIALWKLDETAVKRVLKGGTPVPGARMGQKPSIARRGF